MINPIPDKTIMQLFTINFCAIFTLLISIVNGIKEGPYCLGVNKCTLYMSWSAGSPGLKSGTMAMPKDITLFDKDCKTIDTKMTQAEAKGPIDIKSSLPETITLTGQNAIFEMPLFTYGKNQDGGENCGQGEYKGDYNWLCQFAC